MSFLPDEHPVRLEKLDDHLKAILKIKIREFVHLNPIFNCIPSIDVESYTKISPPVREDLPVRRGMLSQLQEEEALIAAGHAYFSGFDVACPNKFRLTPARRRQFRRSLG
jgi:hypothetical protein